MKIIKLLSIVVAIIGVGYLAFALYLSSGMAHTCRVDQLASAVSPNTLHVARLQIKKCNYKQDALIVLDVSGKEAPNKSTALELGVATTSRIDVAWLSDHRLRVTYPNTFKLSQSPSSLGGVDLELVAR